ncbi:MAG: FAD-dependent oxidoreductase [Chloroflexi bacterium]|nr:FAD-dependent oxidoreductase [Chloroflexota bacterium]
MTQLDQTPDVVVIGGGPAGSTTATMLARKGVRVLLLERDRFPRHHVGESLLPASMPVLEELGVMPAMEKAGFLPKYGATMVWGKDSTPWSWYFRETSRQYPSSFQVSRPEFDQLLLENSRANGVDVREGCRVVEIHSNGGKTTGVGYVSDDGTAGSAHCSLVVDASGQGGILGRTLNLRRYDPFFQNLAVYAYFEGAQRLPQPDETNIFIESYSNGWFWNIPLHTGQTGVGVVVDSKTGQQGIQEFGLEGFLTRQISQAPHTAEMLRNARLTEGPFVVKDWSYTCEPMVGDGHILVGDAACFVDPLFSSGVHLALMGGVMAAALAATTLKGSDIAKPAGRVYEELYLQEYRHFREMARLFYTSNLNADSYFWEARRLLGGDETFSPRHAFIQAVAGQPPRGYERVVLEQGQAPEGFSHSVKAVEDERAFRRAKLEAALDQTDGKEPAIYQAVPCLSPEVSIERQPVLGEGEFVWGQVITSGGGSSGNGQSTPCSPLVAMLVSQIDGVTPVADLLAGLVQGRDENQAAQIAQSVLTALQILYVDGSIEEMKGL